MLKYVATAGALLAFSLAAFAKNASPETNERYRRQFQYAQMMMRLNGVGGVLSTAELAKWEVTRPGAAARFAPARSARDVTLDAFADAVERSIAARRAKGTLPRQWQIEKDFPKLWSISSHPEAAADCARAIEHPLGQTLRIQMDRSGVAWLRVVAPSAGHWAFDTTISEFDTRLSVFRDCRDVSAAPERVSDDSIGLGSNVGLHAKNAGQTFLLKIERMGGFGSIAIAKSAPSASISGRVTRASDGTPLDVTVLLIHSETNYQVDWQSTNANGDYYFQPYGNQRYYLRTIPRVQAYGQEPLVHEAYPDVQCADSQGYGLSLCDGPIEAVDLPEGTQASGIDFVLQRGASVAGVVRDETTGLPLAGAWVGVWLPGLSWGSGRGDRTDALGRFRINGLVARDWRASIEHVDYYPELWDDVDCANECPETSSTPIVLGSNNIATLDVALKPLQAFRVRVDVEGEVPELAHVRVYQPDGTWMFWVQTHPVAGDPREFKVGPLPPGDYRIAAFSSEAFAKVYGGADCESECNTEILGGAMHTLPSAQPEALSISLLRRPILEGTVTEDPSGLPLSNVRATLYYSNGLPGMDAVTDAQGHYSFGPVYSGQYRLLFIAPKHLDEVFDDIRCDAGYPLQCPPGATVFTFGPGSASQVADAALRPSGSITGRFLQSADEPGRHVDQAWFAWTVDNGPLHSTSVYIYDDERYALDDLDEGEYRIRAGASGYHHQLYSGVDCPSPVYGPLDCPFSAGTPVTIASGVVNDGVDFRLMRRNSRVVRVVDDQTSLPLPGIMIDQWRMDGSWTRSVTTDSNGRAFVDGVSTFDNDPSTPVYVSTDSGGNYINEVYDNRLCPVGASVYAGNCPLFPASPLLVPGDDEFLPDVEIRVGSAIDLFTSSFE